MHHNSIFLVFLYMLFAFSFWKNNCHILHIRAEVSVLFLPGTNNFLPYLSNLYNLLGEAVGIMETIKWNSSSYKNL